MRREPERREGGRRGGGGRAADGDGRSGWSEAPPWSRALPDAPVLTIEIEQELDGRWLAEVSIVPGALAYGSTRAEAAARAEALALRALAERIEHGESVPESSDLC